MKGSNAGRRFQYNCSNPFAGIRMTSQRIDERCQQLEARVETLEREIAELKQLLAMSLEKQEPWWQKVAGSFKDDPDFDEAVRLGQEWRKSAE